MTDEARPRTPYPVGEDIGAVLDTFGAVIQGHDGTIAWDVFAQELAFRLSLRAEAALPDSRLRAALGQIEEGLDELGTIPWPDGKAGPALVSLIQVRDVIRAALSLEGRQEPETPWPTRDEFAAMTPAELNAYLESVGADVRVASPEGRQEPER